MSCKVRGFLVLLSCGQDEGFNFPPCANFSVGSNTQMKRRLKIIGTLTAVYVLSYLIFRNSNIEIWDKDGGEWVNLKKGQAWIYYLYKPLIYIDSKLTTLHFNIDTRE